MFQEKYLNLHSFQTSDFFYWNRKIEFKNSEFYGQINRYIER
jgi:hypothetical protein